MKRMKDRPYKSPSGEIVSQKKYLAEWRKITKAVELALDVQVYAFDPDIAVMADDGRGHCSIPIWLAKRVVALAAKD